MARRRRKREEEQSGPPGAPEWIVTFTDMISLLVTFFVLLMTFSSLREYDLLKVAAFLKGERGVLQSRGMTLPEFSEEDLVSSSDVLRGALVPHARPVEELAQNLEEMGQRATDEHLEIDLQDVSDGLLIEFGVESTFAPGSAEVPPALRERLAEIGRVLEHYPHLVVVEGFTDGGFRPTPRHRDADAVAFARAEAAARVLLAESDLPPQLVQISSHGDRRPRASDETASGRRRNRRVRLRVVSLSEMRAAHYDTQRERIREEER